MFSRIYVETCTIFFKKRKVQFSAVFRDNLQKRQYATSFRVFNFREKLTAKMDLFSSSAFTLEQLRYLLSWRVLFMLVLSHPILKIVSSQRYSIREMYLCSQLVLFTFNSMWAKQRRLPFPVLAAKIQDVLALLTVCLDQILLSLLNFFPRHFKLTAI